MADDGMLEVKARCTKTGEVTILKVKKGTPMNEIFDEYAKMKEHDISKLRFKMKDTGDKVNPEANVESLSKDSEKEDAPMMVEARPGEDDGFCSCLT